MFMLLACAAVVVAAIVFMTHVAGEAKRFIGPFTGYAIFGMMAVLLFVVFGFDFDVKPLSEACGFSFAFNFGLAAFSRVRDKHGRLKGYALLLGLVVAPTVILGVLNWKLAALAWAVTGALNLGFSLLGKADTLVKIKGK
jgi:hypothetical protein